MTAVWSVLAGAIVTGIVGNFLVQRWQLMTWRLQQRQLANQAELAQLKKLLEEISIKSADRYNAMRRLIDSLAPNSFQSSDNATIAYQEQLAIWNGSLNSIYVRIRLAVNYGYALRFEQDVHTPFYSAGRAIERVLRQRQRGTTPSWSDLKEPKAQMDRVKGATYIFLRNLTDIVERRREEIYIGRRIPYEIAYLKEYSLFELVKAVFTSRVDCFYVIRPA